MHPSNKSRNSFFYKTSLPNLILKKINSEKVKTEEESSIRKNFNSLPIDNNLKMKANVILTDHSKKEIQVIKCQTKGHNAAYDQCFSGNTYEEECPVNYSLKYSETEPCKVSNKAENPKEKFKEYADYTETDLDQPTNFSLKYAENTCEDDEAKNTDFNYFENDKSKYKQYPDYAETDLDQPTDFTLKYRESTEEDVKNQSFNYYDTEKRKPSTCFEVQPEPMGTPNERASEQYACEQDETPLMFSRCSSLNSLSSFVHITQSIPDDRSSIISDFSRMTSGIISPSELPDSPTQTSPSSPKRVKSFSNKTEFLPKKSVFEDDVATYKQEDTPVEFSRATSLSSLNIENPTKSELVWKTTPTLSSLVGVKDEIQHSLEPSRPIPSKQQVCCDKTEYSKEKFELSSVTEVDETLLPDCINIDIQEHSKKSNQCNQALPKRVNNFINAVSLETHNRIRPTAEFEMKRSIRQNEPEKGYPTFEVAEDVVHTYCTEGTPANISHAGSHSDLSTLSMVSGIPPSGVDDSDEFCSRDAGTMLDLKVKRNEDDQVEIAVTKRLPAETKTVNIIPNPNVFLNNQTRFEYLRKDSQLTAKDETATFATENSPCNFSVRSSLSDLTVSVMESSMCLRQQSCEEPPSEIITPLHNVSPQSPSSIIAGEQEDEEKEVEEVEEVEEVNDCSENSDFWNDKISDTASRENLEDDKNYTKESVEEFSQSESPSSMREKFDFYSSEPLTPFEEALLEQCIRLGMPPKKGSANLVKNHNKFVTKRKPPEERKRDLIFAKSNFDGNKDRNSKTHSDSQNVLCEGAPLTRSETTQPINSANVENFDFDSSEPLTQFEEALLEQCIRLGMPQKKNPKKVETRNNLKSSDGGDREGVNYDSSEKITPLEAALLEQCIRLGMPQKRNQKKSEEYMKSIDPYDESNKIISCVSAQLNRLKINSDTEKEKDGFKKAEYFVCNCGRRHSSNTSSSKRKNLNCRRSKK